MYVCYVLNWDGRQIIHTIAVDIVRPWEITSLAKSESVWMIPGTANND